MRISGYILLILLLPGIVLGQYVGAVRPLGRAETLDSLAKKADSSRVSQLELRFAADSADKQGQIEAKVAESDTLKLTGSGTVSVANDGAHHYTVNGTGAGSSGAKPGDLVIATDGSGDWNIWNPLDSAAFADTLKIAVDSLGHLLANRGRKSGSLWIGPGTYLMADTVWGRSTSWSSIPITLQGAPGGTTLNFTAAGSYSLHGNFTNKTGSVWENVTFKDLVFSNPANNSNGFFDADTLAARRNENVIFRGCKFHKWTYAAAYGSYNAAGLFTLNHLSNKVGIAGECAKQMAFYECQFDSVNGINGYARETLFSRCSFSGSFFQAVRECKSSGVAVLQDCAWFLTSASYFTESCAIAFNYNTSARVAVEGGVFTKAMDYYYINLNNATIAISGLRVVDPIAYRGVTKIENFSSNQHDAAYFSLTGCYSERMSTTLDGGASGQTVNGCTFADSGSVNFNGSYGTGAACLNNTFRYATTAITVGSGATGAVVGDNVFFTCGTGLSDSGTGTVKYNNNSVTLEDIRNAQDWLLAWSADIRRAWRSLFPAAGYQLPG